MGNKQSRTNARYSRRDSAPNGRTRRSLWLQRGRLSAPYERTFDIHEAGRASVPAAAPLPRSDHRTTTNSRAPLHIRVTNLRQHEKLAYPLVLIEGRVDNLDASNLPDSALYVQAVAHATEQVSNSWVGSVCWPVVRESGHFKAYVHLAHPGVFHIRLRIATATHQLTLRFAPRKTKWVVRFHYQKPHDSYQGFDAPNGVDNSDSDACQRLKFNAMVLQTTVAELFHRAGFSRKTFALELDSDGFPVVDVLRSKHSIGQARRMTDSQLLVHLNTDVQGFEEQKQMKLGSPAKQPHTKHVILLGGSHFDPRTQRISDYRALVGGNVIATSSYGLFTWPRGLNEFTTCCFNSDFVSPEFVIDERSVHQSYWANYSGGISVLLHLMGLSFGLKHRPDGIMHKNFRQATRLLAVMEPRSGKQQIVAIGCPIGDGRFGTLQRQAFKPVGAAREEIYLDELSIGQLALQCRWISPYSMKYAAKEIPATAA